MKTILAILRTNKSNHKSRNIGCKQVFSEQTFFKLWKQTFSKEYLFHFNRRKKTGGEMLWIIAPVPVGTLE